MSRPSALRETLKLPSTHALEVVSIVASGDCFYDCIHELLIRQHAQSASFETSLLTLPLVCSRKSTSVHVLAQTDTNGGGDNSTNGGDEGSINGGGDGSTDPIPTSQSMRDFVADKLTAEQLDRYKMFAAAGLDEYDFSTDLTLEGIKHYARKSGKANGPGKCFWADEFALRTISDGLHLTLLIVDDQATRAGGARVGRKRRMNNRQGESSSSSSLVDDRFIFVGDYPRCVLLHRSRRQHFNALVIDRHPVILFEQIPLNVRSLWPVNFYFRKNIAAGSDEPTSKSCLSDNDLVNGKKKMKQCFPEEGEEKRSRDRGDDRHSNPPNACDKEPASTAPTASPLPTSPPARTLGSFYCGCAGFSSSSWVGNFYPRGVVGRDSDRQLSFYQQHFRAVEINSTFYGIPSESTVTKWKNAFSKSFRVVVKAPKGLTHERPQLDVSVLSTFMSRMRPLGGTLACVLIQCPRTIAVTLSQLEQVKRTMDEESSWYRGCIAFEFRDKATYFDEKVRDFLKQNSFALVMHPDSLGRSTVGTSACCTGGRSLSEYQPEPITKVAAAGTLTSSIVYLRLHGFNDEHSGEYSMDQLEEIAEQIHFWRVRGLEVFCFILNDLQPARCPSSSPQKIALQPWGDGWCAMPKNAKQLEYLVYRTSNEEIPHAPKKPRSTMLNFFGKKKAQPSAVNPKDFWC